MISNRHIRRDYAEGMDMPFSGRRKAMCGKRVSHKLSGIPGVTPQETLVNTSVGIRPGWCLTCAYELALYVGAFLDNSRRHPTSVSAVLHQELCRKAAIYCMVEYFRVVPPPDREEPQNNAKFDSILGT